MVFVRSPRQRPIPPREQRCKHFRPGNAYSAHLARPKWQSGAPRGAACSFAGSVSECQGAARDRAISNPRIFVHIDPYSSSGAHLRMRPLRTDTGRMVRCQYRRQHNANTTRRPVRRSPRTDGIRNLYRRPWLILRRYIRCRLVRPCSSLQSCPCLVSLCRSAGFGAMWGELYRAQITNATNFFPVNSYSTFQGSGLGFGSRVQGGARAPRGRAGAARARGFHVREFHASSMRVPN